MTCIWTSQHKTLSHWLPHARNLRREVLPLALRSRAIPEGLNPHTFSEISLSKYMFYTKKKGSEFLIYLNGASRSLKYFFKVGVFLFFTSSSTCSRVNASQEFWRNSEKSNPSSPKRKWRINWEGMALERDRQRCRQTGRCTHIHTHPK